MKMKLFFLTIVVSAIFLNGCDNRPDVDDLRNYVAKLKQKIESRKNNDALSALRLPSPPAYTIKLSRSPFADYAVVKSVSTDPLQASSIDKLRFMGTLVESNGIVAYILTPDNKVYPVKIGDIIGDKYGKITKIYPDRIEVTEPVTPESGENASTRIVVLQLKEES
jgi:type IV pilus assembly protein PilP